MNLNIQAINPTELVLSHKPEGVDDRLYIAMVSICAVAYAINRGAATEWLNGALDMLENLAGVEMFDSVQAGVVELSHLTEAQGSVQ